MEDNIISAKDKIFEQARRERDLMMGKKPEPEIVTKKVTPDDLAEIKQMLTIILNKVRAIDLIVRDRYHAPRRTHEGEQAVKPQQEETRQALGFQTFIEGEKE